VTIFTLGFAFFYLKGNKLLFFSTTANTVQPAAKA
jgi:hypothetical protein